MTGRVSMSRGTLRRANMTRVSMLISFVAFGSQTTVVLADNIPTFDVAATCRAESQGDPGAGIAAACTTQERSARVTLAKQWAQFTPESRITCMQTETDVSGVRSYVELLTRLQIAKDVKTLPKE